MAMYALARRYQAPEEPAAAPVPAGRFGLTARMVLVIGMALAPVVAMVAYSFQEHRSRAMRDAQTEVLHLADRARVEIQGVFDSVRNLLLAVARSEEALRPDAGRCAAYFRGLRADLPQFRNIGLIGEDGFLLCSAQPVAATVDLSDRAYYRGAREGRTLAVGVFQHSRIAGFTSINVGYPVLKADGAPGAVAYVALDLAALNRALEGVDAPSGGTVTLFDREGTIVARHPDAERWVGTRPADAALAAGVREAAAPRVLTGLDGVERLYSFVRVQPEQSGMVVAVGIPVETILAPSESQLATTIVRLLVALSIALVGAWALGWYWVVQPAAAVVRAARRIASGDFSARSGVTGIAGELGAIGHAFDEMAESLERSETRYRATFEQAALGIAHLSREGRFLRANPKLCEMLGYGPGELLELDFQRITHPDDIESSYRFVRRVMAQGGAGQVLEKRHLRKDGTPVWNRVSLSLVRAPQGESDYFVAVLDDIGDRKWAQRRVERLAAMYRTLSETNEAIVRVHELPALFQKICEIVSGFGGFALAWVGTVNPARQALEVAAAAGAQLGYLESLTISLGTGNPQGPSALAAEGGEMVICKDFLSDPLTAPWRERGRRHGIAASAAFPLRQGGRVAAVLSVYSGEAGFFDEEIVALLQELALNLSFALDAMAHDAERRAAEAALKRNDERLDAMLRLSEAAGELSEQEITRRALAEGIRLSESRAGCVYFVSEDRQSLRLAACVGIPGNTEPPLRELALAGAGPWADAVRLRRPVILNAPGGAGAVPEAGFRSLRHAVLPAGDRGRVNSVLVVGGRDSDYLPEELRQLQLVGETLWRLMEGKRAQRRVLEAEAKFRATFEHTAVGMANVGLDGRFLLVNRRFCELLGYSKQEILARSFQDVIQSEDLSQDLELVKRLMAGDIPRYTVEKRHVYRDGSVGWGLLTVSTARKPDGQVDYFIAVVEDITELKAAQERLRLDAMVFEGSREGITITDAEARILACNRAFTQITGYEEHEVLGKTPAILQSGRQDREFYRALWESLTGTGRWSGEIWNRRKNGEVYPEWLAISALEGSDGAVSHYIGIFSDISTQKQAEATIQRLLQYDHLTQLPNRALFRERLELSLAHVRHRRRKAAVLLLNLARFRGINETLGHPAGDAVLKEVAARITGALRSGDTVSRLDADNFAVVLNDLERSEDAGTLASKLLEVVAAPVRAGSQELRLTAWIGVSVFPEDGDDGEALMRRAQAALSSARSEPLGGCRFADSALNAASDERRLLAGELRGALERGELVIHYQPLVDLVSGDMNGVEALLRWKHPRLGMVLPGRFVRIAEETGLISSIGEWALVEICRQGQRWREQYEPGLRLSVNVSSLQIRDGTLPRAVRRALQLSGLLPAALELEVTESYFLTQLESNRKTLQALKDLGVSFAIDDFGTHYAGLGFMRHFPVDRVKVDQSFIREIATHAGDAAICRAIIAMAHGLGMKVSAEGVETEAQLKYLRMLHCDEAQGFYFSPAVAPEEVEKTFNVPSRLFDVEPPQRTLLLVDDEPNVLASLNRALRREGYRILSAGSAREGLEMLATQNVGVILSDQRMPDMTGTEFLGQVKLMHPRVVRIILSGHTDLATITDAINRGAVYKFLTKPWEDGVLRDTLREAFERYETARVEGGPGS
jgi:PAS domain S-box-containing protein/diguanylate cyclase (GGDEF)-like protein